MLPRAYSIYMHDRVEHYDGARLSTGRVENVGSAGENLIIRFKIIIALVSLYCYRCG